MKRLTLLLAGAALWLFLAAIPALADGGPHVKTVNNGSLGLNADSCAGCHRAHTAQTDRLLTTDETALCLTCHGAGNTGATTNVVNGVQLVPASNPVNRTGVVLGALRDGGFASAAIGSANAVRVTTGAMASYGQPSNAKIPVRVVNGALEGDAVTSAHMAVPGQTGLTFQGTTWGNLTGTPGLDVAGSTGNTMECSSCHNPHGNGQYRILQKQPAPATIGNFKGSGVDALVDDAALPPVDSAGAWTDTRNYTVIQTLGGTGTLLASQVNGTYTNLQGDYLRKQVPWNAGYGQSAAADAPNAVPTTFNTQMAAWCSSCHTQYLASGSADNTSSNIFHNRHQSNPSHGANSVGYITCTTCHVAHGSNAQMVAGGYSANVNNPGQAVGTVGNAGDSRLLKADNRGICQTCHDPTFTVFAIGTVNGGPLPANVPAVPYLGRIVPSGPDTTPSRWTATRCQHRSETARLPIP